MLTTSMLTRLWRTARYRQLIRRLVEGRPESVLALDHRLGGPTAAAALGLLRLGELNHASHPVSAELRDRLLLSQCRDGSWGQTSSEKSMLTALCLRGLAALPTGWRFTGLGMHVPVDRSAVPPQSAAVARGVGYLAASLEPDGGWHGDAFATGFVLLELGRLEAFCAAVPMAELMSRGRAWQAETDSEDVRLVWSLARRRCGKAQLQAGSAGRVDRRHQGLIFADVA